VNLTDRGRTLYAADQPAARPLPTQGSMDAEEKQAHIHASNGIRTHDPSVRAGEDISCRRLRGRRTRQFWSYLTKIYLWRSFETVIIITICFLMCKVLYSDGVLHKLKSLSLCQKLPAFHPTISLSWSKFLMQTQTEYSLQKSRCKNFLLYGFLNKILIFRKENSVKRRTPVWVHILSNLVPCDFGLKLVYPWWIFCMG
jgi:hypothetical protein